MDEHDPEGAAELAQRLTDYMYDIKSRLDPRRLTFGCEFEYVLAEYRPLTQAPKTKFRFGKTGGAKDEGKTGGESDVEETGTRIKRREDHGKEIVREALSKPLSVKCIVPGCKIAHTLDLPLTHKESKERYVEWQVTYDASASPIETELQSLGEARVDYRFYGIEVRSRVLNFHEPLKTREEGHDVNFEEEITAVLNRLNDRFHILAKGNEEPGYHLLVTDRCGLHVHVGNHRQGIPFSVVKKLYSTFVACERQIDGLHAVSRITGSKLGTRVLHQAQAITGNDRTNLIDWWTFNKPLSHHFIIESCLRRLNNEQTQREKAKKDSMKVIGEGWLGKQNVGDKIYKDSFGLDISSWLQQVQAAKTARELRELHHRNDTSCTINLTHLQSPETPRSKSPYKKLTIEFRQHAGTLHPPTVMSWLDVVTKLVLRCDKLEDEEFLGLIDARGGKLRDPRFSSLEFCKFIGCSRRTMDYYSRLLTSSLNEYSAHLVELDIDANEAIARGLPIGNLAVECVRSQRTDLDADAVNERIMRKLLVGGYGQFSESDLKVLLPESVHAAERRAITIGYKAPIKPISLSQHQASSNLAPTSMLQQMLSRSIEAPLYIPAFEPLVRQAAQDRKVMDERSRSRGSRSPTPRRHKVSWSNTSSSSDLSQSNDSRGRGK